MPSSIPRLALLFQWVDDSTDPTHTELKQRILLEEACSKSNPREALEAAKAFIRASILSATIQDDTSVIDDAVFGRVCESTASMERCLPRPEDEPAKSWLKNVIEKFGEYATYWESLANFNKARSPFIIAGGTLIRTHKFALCEQVCRIYDISNEDEMRSFENIEKALVLNLSANDRAYVYDKLEGVFHP
ncbi:hypothetical protein IMSHALPRED_003437 [Imshaugia aleurites]|uniref:Uncharacterized protein n=1 Tax=Imshaugia aleurites TaxID=172621 RepID=A0A8H3PJC3_9LECA|nr:hypothetical protein IMSHALPRED_003437 [Imshaugia aleurites]